MVNSNNRIGIRLVKNKEVYSKPSYMSDKMYDSDLVVISKSRIALMVNELPYIET